MSWLYKVTGKRAFPLDMLRHDRAFPADGDAVQAIYLATQPGNRVSRMVLLCGELTPTEGRWSSFGWEVSEAKEFKLGGRRTSKNSRTRLENQTA